MTTPRVTELPRHLEPISSDTFLGGVGEARSPAPPPPARELRPLGVVLPLRPRDPARGPAKRRRNRRPPHSRGMPGPGGDAA